MSSHNDNWLGKQLKVILSNDETLLEGKVLLSMKQEIL